MCFRFCRHGDRYIKENNRTVRLGKNEAMEFMGGIKDGLKYADEWLHLSVRSVKTFSSVPCSNNLFSRDPIERFVSGFVDKCMIEQ